MQTQDWGPGHRTDAHTYMILGDITGIRCYAIKTPCIIYCQINISKKQTGKQEVMDAHTLGLPPTSMVKPGAGRNSNRHTWTITRLHHFHGRSPTNRDQQRHFLHLSLTRAAQYLSPFTPHSLPQLVIILPLPLHPHPTSSFFTLTPLHSPPLPHSPHLLFLHSHPTPSPLTHASASWSYLSREQLQCSFVLVPHCQPEHSLSWGEALTLPCAIHLLSA